MACNFIETLCLIPTDIIQTLRFKANIPLCFLGESLQTTCYLINRLPTPLLKHKSPFELLHHRSPDYSTLRVFGCLCYATNLFPKHKFDARARRCVFFGYPLDQKHYNIIQFYRRTHSIGDSNEIRR